MVTKGSGSQIITTRFEKRDDASIIRNYGELLVDVASTVPDGIVCFFTSYQYMESIVQKWEEIGILREVGECSIEQGHILYHVHEAGTDDPSPPWPIGLHSF